MRTVGWRWVGRGNRTDFQKIPQNKLLGPEEERRAVGRKACLGIGPAPHPTTVSTLPIPSGYIFNNLGIIILVDITLFRVNGKVFFRVKIALSFYFVLFYIYFVFCNLFCKLIMPKRCQVNSEGIQSSINVSILPKLPFHPGCCITLEQSPMCYTVGP